MELINKRVLVFGAGKSGIGAAKLLEKKSAEVILYDANSGCNVEELEKREITIILGEFPTELLGDIDVAVLSPGVPTDLPLIQKMRDNGIVIWGEIELAYICGKGDILGITGTNGKTTTTALLGEIMKRYNSETFVVGNIGNAYTDSAKEMTENSVVVAELSSFQLETIETFHPKVSAILNIAPDHLDRHHTMEAYIEAKERIAKNQGPEDICVLNYEDEELRRFGEKVKASVIYFSSKQKLNSGVYLENGNIIYCNTEKISICHVGELHLLGVHNYENVMAAIAMALAYKVPLEIIREGVREFKGVAHRIEYVGEYNGVKYYNDSKGTNPDAAIKGIQAMERPTYLIGGGYDKNASYDEWIDSFEGKVKKLVLLGATRELIAAAAEKKGFSEIKMVDSLEEAVSVCRNLAQPGDAVLLSPACASWGMFANYEERGDKFKELVRSKS